ncbi:hypothetical protein [Yersinia pekkanenii]|uniref:Uncharacterized protein n=1 Tax=Yersinia pekkanenii TaxID=1288385 RepID=A0A0T9QFH6_9GAMM|nr:hypothetical protein [Yersinia pekkanenii]CNI09346.1 Uncharacterised protein [Yersinia pekkanenii]CRY68011.1 Uncharacterised protein [Yersinia pekkanenii]
MTHMLYKPGGDTKVWGTLAHIKIVEADEIEQHIEDGWLPGELKTFLNNLTVAYQKRHRSYLIQ